MAYNIGSLNHKGKGAGSMSGDGVVDRFEYRSLSIEVPHIRAGLPSEAGRRGFGEAHRRCHVEGRPCRP
jgi:hypothetical protein